MADKINLKVFLDPDVSKLKTVTDDLSKTVQDTGNKKLIGEFDQIQQKVKTVVSNFQNTDFGRESFKAFGSDLKKVFGDLEKFANKMGNMDLVSGVKEYQEQWTVAFNKIEALKKKINKNSRGMRQTDTNDYEMTDYAKNKRIKDAGLTRKIKVKGQEKDSSIASYEAATNYLKQLESEGKKNTKTYQDLAKVIKDIAKEERNRAAELVKDTKELEDQQSQAKELLDTIEKTTSAQGESPIKQAAGKAIVSANKGKLDVVDHIASGLKKDEDNKDLKIATSQTKELGVVTEKNNGVFGKAIQNLTSYTLILGTMKRALRSAIQTVKVLDTSLTEQAMVAGKTKGEMQKLLVSYQDIAKQTGATTKEVAEVATQYFRQGKTAQEALVLTEAAVSAAKVGAISTAESVDYLTTAINGFGMAAEDAMAVSDRFAALAANSATNYEELAVALSKCASQANLAGMSMDYTLGLLAKGIETTREAPETIGTALKTIIARMREMTDYGKTLEGDVDINNLETQLNYVGIALRSSNGELRSTQDVLDEIGRSWNTFSANQQAALAKALAGTRQQSRLISIMQNYDRTLELVDISQNSVGATAAQMSTYMTSIEAATNAVSVAWEQFITNLTETDVIIDALNFVAQTITKIAEFASTDIGAVTILSSILLITGTVLGLKLQEKEIARQQLAYQQEQAIAEEKENQQIALQNLLESENEKVAAAAMKLSDADLHLEIAKTKLLQLQAKVKRGEKVSAKELYKAEQGVAKATEKRKEAELELSDTLREESMSQDDFLKIQQKINGLSEKQNVLLNAGSGLIGGLIFGASKLFGIFKGVAGLIQLGLAGLLQQRSATKKLYWESKKVETSNKIRAAFGMAESASAIPGVGWAIGAGIIAALVGISVGIAAAAGAFDNQEDKDKARIQETTQTIQDLNAKIVQLNNSISAIDNVTSVFNRMNKGVIKTKEEVEELNKAVTAAKEKLSDDEKTRVNNAGDIDQQVAELQKIREEKQKEFDAIRKIQIDIINSGDDTAKLLEDAKNQAVVYDIVTSAINRQTEALKALIAQKIRNGELSEEEGEKEEERVNKTQEVVNGLIHNIDALDLNNIITGEENKVLDKWQRKDSDKWTNKWDEKVWDDIVIGTGYHNSSNKKKVWNAIKAGDWETVAKVTDKNIAQKIYNKMGYDEIQLSDDQFAEDFLTGVNNAKITIKNKEGEDQEISAVDILTDSNSSSSDIIAAYDAIKESIKTNITNEEQRKLALDSLEKSYGQIYNNAFAVQGWGEDAASFINNKNISARQLSEFENQLINLGVPKEKIGKVMSGLGQGKDIFTAIQDVTGKTLTEKQRKQAVSAYTNVMSNASGGSIQQSTQGTTKLKNDIANFYKKQSEYLKGDMDPATFADFVSTNPDFFNQPGAYEAFVSGGDLSPFIKDVFQPRVRETINSLKQQKVNAELEGNIGLVKTLDKMIKELEDEEGKENEAIYQTNLETRLEKEKAFLDQYKKYKQEEADAQKKALEEQKSAYEEYFDAINENEEDEEYEEKRKLLLSNLTKLGANTDSTSMRSAKEIEEELRKNEEERLKTLKEQTKEKIIGNIDETIQSIDKTLEDLLSQDQELLNYLFNAGTKDMLNTSARQIFNGKESDTVKASSFSELIREMARNLPQSSLDKLIDIREEGGSVFLNIAGDSYNIGTKEDQSSIWNAIKDVLNELGIQ